MIVAALNQKGGVGKTTLALHLAGAWAVRVGRRSRSGDPMSAHRTVDSHRARAIPMPGSARASLRRRRRAPATSSRRG